MALYTSQWLEDQLRSGKLSNTTLLLIGREEEGERFFGSIRKVIEQNQTCTVDDIKLLPFTLDETFAYFQALESLWQSRARENSAFEQIADTMHHLANDSERLETIWLYTEGQAVRLALYADLIVEGRAIPEPLQDTPVKALQRIQGIGLDQARLEIENEFIRLLFANVSRRARILQTLVRAPRGLDAEQIDFAVNSPAEAVPETWIGRADQQELQKIREEIRKLENLTIVKKRSHGRLALQDEIYRIYADHLSRNERDLHDEQTARRQLYEKLQMWADYHQNLLEKTRNEFQTWDLLGLKLDNPAQSRQVSFPPITEKTAADRSALLDEIQAWELESAHYSLLLDPARNINHDFFELGYRWWRASDEDSDAVAQTELWQVLEDSYTLRFVPMKTWPRLERRGEPVLDLLKRVARQDDVTRWIKRFVLRNQYTRAIQFCDAVEREIQTFEGEAEHHSWTHTFSRHERGCWRGYANILRSQDVPSTLEEMTIMAAELEHLASCDQHTLAFPERNEEGFIGHPGEARLRRTIAILYNFIGYGYASLGLSRESMVSYGKSLQYMRDVEFLSQQATTRNNLSRVLSVRGYNRSRRVCLDGLNLRRQEGADVPIAYSYNTLALIDNDHLRSDLAWKEAAVAAAYFRRAEEARGLGLALIQLAEALRRVAGKGMGYFLSEPGEIVYDEAERTITEAIELFSSGPASGEPVRLIEAWTEMGCLQRDRILSSDGSQRKERRYRDALYYLELAAQEAHKHGNLRLQLDAQVNIAWTHYYNGDFDQAEQNLRVAEGYCPQDSWIRKGQDLPEADRNDPHVYHQLSKIYGLRGKIAMDRFREQTERLESAHPNLDRQERHEIIHRDETAQRNLQIAAESYVLGLGYAQLLSPRSSALNIAYDALYEYLKEFNTMEMRDFKRYEVEARLRYRTNEISLIDLGNLDEFMRDSFGMYTEES